MSLAGSVSVQSLRDPFDRACKPERIEPDVRILVGTEQIERLAVPPVDRVFERRLETAADVDDERGVADGLHVARRDLDVVRLGAGRREVDDLSEPSPATRSAAHARG